MRIAFMLILLSISSFCFSQDTYMVGVLSSPGFTMKFEMMITISDSLFTTKVPGHEAESKKLIKGSKYEFYVTDGTATDKVVITPFSGKLKGFTYDYSIVYNQDAKFNGKQLVYFCKKKD